MNNIFKMLEEFSSLREEINETKKRIEKIERLNGQCVSDVVMGSDKEFPFVSHPVKIVGVMEASKKIEEQHVILLSRLSQLQEVVTQLQEFIDSIEDSEVRRILQFRYVDNKTYKEVAQAMGYEGDGSTQMKHMRNYLRKNFVNL